MTVTATVTREKISAKGKLIPKLCITALRNMVASVGITYVEQGCTEAVVVKKELSNTVYLCPYVKLRAIASFISYKGVI